MKILLLFLVLYSPFICAAQSASESTWQRGCDSSTMSQAEYRACINKALHTADSIATHTYNMLVHQLDSFYGITAFGIRSRSDSAGLAKMEAIEDLRKHVETTHTYFLGYRDRMINTLARIYPNPVKREFATVRYCLNLSMAHTELLKDIFAEAKRF